MAILFHDDCSSLGLGGWFVDAYTGDVTTDGFCYYGTQELDGNKYKLSADIKRIVNMPMGTTPEVVTDVRLPMLSASESAKLQVFPSIYESVGETGSNYCQLYFSVSGSTIEGEFYGLAPSSFSFVFTPSSKVITTGCVYKMVKTATGTALYEDDVLITEIADEDGYEVNGDLLVLGYNLYKITDTDTTSDKSPAIYDIKITYGVDKYQFAHGDGTEENPYEIWNAEDLNGVRDYLDSYFIQTADIVLESAWTSWSDFEGYYDGDGYTIANLDKALIDIARESTIKNLGLIDVDITSDSFGTLANNVWGATIEECYSTGSIKGSANRMGGLIGILQDWLSKQASVKNCYSTCSVENTNASESYTGGFVGNAGYTLSVDTLENCYSGGIVTAAYTAGAGGFAGYKTSLSTITNCFYDSTTSGQSDTGKGVPETTAQMKEQSTFTGWDFDTIWNIDGVTNDGYPFLRGQKPSDGYNLTITVEGNGTTSPQAGTSQHEAGKNVLLIAYPEPGHKLLRWEGYGVEDTESEYTQIKMTANRSVKAVFAEEAILKLVAAGGGTTNPPPGEISYAKGQVVTLKAAPHRGFKFKEWTKDISSTNDVYELLMDGDKTVWAIFDDDEDDKSTKRKLYFATAREKAFWMINGKWRFFATPVHSNLKKLEADDHKQYLNNERHDKISRHRLGDTVPHDSHENLNNVGFYSHKKIDEHIESMENPHLVTATQVGAIPYLYGDTLPEAGEEYRGFFFTLPGEAGPPEVEDKLYYCRSVDGGTTYEWKEIIFV